MALFAGKERTRIEQLEAELAEAQAHHSTYVDDITKDVATREGEIQRLKDEMEQAALDFDNTTEAIIAQMKEAQDAISHESALTAANLEGQVSVNAAKAAKWDALSLGWVWHNDGKVEIDGVTYRRLSARKDNPLADWAIPVVEGQDFP